MRAVKGDVFCRVCGKDLLARYDCRGKQLCSNHYKTSQRNPELFRYLLDVAAGRTRPTDAHAKDFDRVRVNQPLLEQWDALVATRKPRKDLAARHFWR